MARWTLDDINWQKFDPSKVTPDMVSLVKAACMVEHNGYDYAKYLCGVFADDDGFKQVAGQWAEEEVQHGRALRKWAELADPSFDFDKSFKAFTEGYQLQLDVEASIRGSRAGELIARCIVEIGTSTYYTAIRDNTEEPVLREICARISTDEVHHYLMFHEHEQRYLKLENIGFWQRLRIALGRIAESEDDELAYAYYAAHMNTETAPYDHKRFKNIYLKKAYSLYRREHVMRMVVLLFKAIGVKPRLWVNRILAPALWGVMQLRAKTVRV